MSSETIGAIAINYKYPVPPKYTGTKIRDAQVIDNWIYLVRKYLKVHDLSGELAVSFATSLLDGSALQFWRRAEESGAWPNASKDLEEFFGILRTRYYPFDHILQVRKQLNALRQTGTVSQYTTEFEYLVFRVPVTEHSVGDLIANYLNGLKPNLRYQVQITHPATFEAAATAAEKWEENFANHRNNLYKRQSHNYEREAYNVIPINVDHYEHACTSGQTYRGYRQPIIRSIKCYNCGRDGHISRNCPAKQTAQTQRARERKIDERCS